MNELTSWANEPDELNLNELHSQATVELNQARRVCVTS
jgi:hypothetical protein